MVINRLPTDCAKPVTVMSFDYGTEKIGIAIGQSISSTAEPLTIIKAKDGIPNWSQITSLIESWRPNFFVVGLPYNLDGSDSKLLQRALKFAQRLNGRFNIPTFGIDERFSSRAAEEKLKKENRRKTSDAGVDDIAAQIILETWFAEYNKKSNCLIKPII